MPIKLLDVTSDTPDQQGTEIHVFALSTWAGIVFVTSDTPISRGLECLHVFITGQYLRCVTSDTPISRGLKFKL